MRSKARGRAAEHGLAFDLAPEYLFSLWEETGGRCAITGRAFDLTPWGGKGDTNPNGPSIDRIEPSDGYVAGNVRLVVAHVNLALARYGEEALRQLCRDILGFGKDSDW